ncbi:hypothetical protein C9374_002275 [Naegleria lovaniensis]|uniref:Uncharacterized protein n=1 Tax=Naegleria lovaniensis TaxID=51637 RepID=A0AA88KMI6_NAELO|nr:uncharacterized protein C9374_002275 [Naegleria lovaniensis]KAG2386531.1 hypothetical protein C9374_002275 [Naegleria lovaniensis]
MEARKLELKYSKIVDSYARHLPRNVRVMKPLETLFAVKEVREERDDNLAEKIKNSQNKLIHLIQEIADRKQKISQILTAESSNDQYLKAVEDECNKLIKNVNEMKVAPAEDTGDKLEFSSGVVWDSQEVDTQVNKFVTVSKTLANEVKSITDKLGHSEKSLAISKRNQEYSITEEDKLRVSTQGNSQSSQGHQKVRPAVPQANQSNEKRQRKSTTRQIYLQAQHQFNRQKPLNEKKIIITQQKRRSIRNN